MDAIAFDALVKRLADRFSRRAALSRLGGGLAMAPAVADVPASTVAPVPILDAWVTGFRDGDVARVAGLFADDCVVTDDVLGLSSEGREHLTAELESLFTAFPERSLDLTGRHDGGSVIVAEWIFSGTQELHLATLPASLKPITLRGVGIFEVEAGLVQRLTLAYVDLVPALVNVGLLSPPRIVGGPEIIDATSDAATVTWQTDQLSAGVVDYGLTPELGRRRPREPVGLAIDHRVELAPLKPGETYYVQVRSANAAGATTSDEVVSFATPACRPGQGFCDGVCIDIVSDPANCGGCGILCPTGECSNGECCTFEGCCPVDRLFVWCHPDQVCPDALLCCDDGSALPTCCTADGNCGDYCCSPEYECGACLGDAPCESPEVGLCPCRAEQVCGRACCAPGFRCADDGRCRNADGELEGGKAGAFVRIRRAF